MVAVILGCPAPASSCSPLLTPPALGPASPAWTHVPLQPLFPPLPWPHVEPALPLETTSRAHDLPGHYHLQQSCLQPRGACLSVFSCVLSPTGHRTDAQTWELASGRLLSCSLLTTRCEKSGTCVLVGVLQRNRTNDVCIHVYRKRVTMRNRSRGYRS